MAGMQLAQAAAIHVSLITCACCTGCVLRQVARRLLAVAVSPHTQHAPIQRLRQTEVGTCRHKTTLAQHIVLRTVAPGPMLKMLCWITGYPMTESACNVLSHHGAVSLQPSIRPPQHLQGTLPFPTPAPSFLQLY